MNQPPPLSLGHSDREKTDAKHLQLLAIFHFVLGGMSAVGIGVLLLQYRMMSSFLSDVQPSEFSTLFYSIVVIGGLLLIIHALLNFLSGFFILKRRSRTFSLIIAALNCLQIPLGTILGVFTILVLGRDSVREEYERNKSFH